MRDDICTIPISEVFEVRDGCPFCRIRNTLESHLTEYILGAAMMEPDVRMETNRLGFCAQHAQLLLKGKNRLSLALMLQSRLDEAARRVLPEHPKLFGDTASRAREEVSHCFLCEKIDHSMEGLVETFFRLWKSERDFRALAASQPIYCLPHYAMLLSHAKPALGRGAADFEKELSAAARTGLDALRADIGHFCEMFDYRNAGGDWGNSRDAVERAVRFLNADLPI